MSLRIRPFANSLGSLQGNTRTAVLFEPLWGIPYTLYNFYLSLYMKSQGVTDEQIGFLISLGYVAGAFWAFFSGKITDALGRRKTTIIFDLIAWPGSILIYIFARSFPMFALATLVGSAVRVVSVSWNLMVVEDADNEQQVLAYNAMNIINISVGILTPVAGIFVLYLGIVNAERILMGFAVVSMTLMMLGRNYYFRETRVGQQILDERRAHRGKFRPRTNSFRELTRYLKNRPQVGKALLITVLFNVYLPIGTYTSLYFAPYLTEGLRLDKSAISLLGGVNAAVMLLVLILLIPRIPRINRSNWNTCMRTGIVIQAIGLVFLIISPPGRFLPALGGISIIAMGFAIGKPFLDTLLANVTGGKERSGIFALNNTVISVLCAIIGLASGYLYNIRPYLIYIFSLGLLALIFMVLLRLEPGNPPEDQP
ncbi:MAG TPA: MFS transporter [Bacillota bacterium]